MDRKTRKLQLASAAAVLLLMLCTLIAYFVVPCIADESTRRALGDGDAYVTDTARASWIYVDDRNVITIYPERLLSDTLVIPDAVNGYAAKTFTPPVMPALHIKTVVFPKTISFFPQNTPLFDGWESLETVAFAHGAEELPVIRFDRVPSLSAIYFPKTLTRAPSLSLSAAITPSVTVYFAGTEAQWLALGDDAAALCERYRVVFDAPYGQDTK